MNFPGIKPRRNLLHVEVQMTESGPKMVERFELEPDDSEALLKVVNAAAKVISGGPDSGEQVRSFGLVLETRARAQRMFWRRTINIAMPDPADVAEDAHRQTYPLRVLAMLLRGPARDATNQARIDLERDIVELRNEGRSDLIVRLVSSWALGREIVVALLSAVRTLVTVFSPRGPAK